MIFDFSFFKSNLSSDCNRIRFDKGGKFIIPKFFKDRPLSIFVFNYFRDIRAIMALICISVICTLRIVHFNLFDKVIRMHKYKPLDDQVRGTKVKQFLLPTPT